MPKEGNIGRHNFAFKLIIIVEYAMHPQMSGDEPWNKANSPSEWNEY